MFPSFLIARDRTRSTLPGSNRTLDAVRSVTIRRATDADRRGIERVAQLDSRRAPEGEVLVAEVDGEVIAAKPLSGEQTVADPFRPTAPVVRLLEMRAGELHAAGGEAALRAAPGVAPPLRALTR